MSRMMKMEQMEQMEAVEAVEQMEAGESDQDCIISCEDDEDDSDANCIISSDDDANLLAAKWSEYVSRSMTRFLRYNGFEQGMLTDDGWIRLGTLVRYLQLGAYGEQMPTWKANLDSSMISTHDVLHEVRQNGKPGKLPYFELWMSGQQVWVRATPGKRRYQ